MHTFMAITFFFKKLYYDAVYFLAIPEKNNKFLK
jgi:hypothetical protein